MGFGERLQITGAAPVSHVMNARDELGNVVDWATTSTRPELTTSGSVGYDRRNRIASWDHGQTDPHLFDYDELGNLVLHGGEVQDFGGPSAGPHAVSARAGRSYSYEGGNIATATGGGEDPRCYEFDSADRLICVSSGPSETCDVLQVWYDAAGNRVREATSDTVREFLGHHHVFEDNPNTLGIGRTEITAFGEVVATVVSDRVQAATWPAYPGETPRWLYAVVGGLPAGLAAWLLVLALRGGLVVGVARRPGMASVSAVVIVVLVSPHHALGGGGGSTERSYRWVMTDALGSSVAIFDDQGLLLHQTRYTPFGQVDAEFDPGDPYARDFYAGHPAQEETGLVYMRARWMDPQTGTFLSVDPVVPNAADPQSLNAYSYARNNPVSRIDPTGEASFWIPGELTPDGISVLVVTPDSLPTSSAPSFPDLGNGGLEAFGLGTPGGAITYALNGRGTGNAGSGSTEVARAEGPDVPDPMADELAEVGKEIRHKEKRLDEIDKQRESLKSEHFHLGVTPIPTSDQAAQDAGRQRMNEIGEMNRALWQEQFRLQRQLDLLRQRQDFLMESNN